MAHILYLDDEEALIFLVTRMLEFLGHKAFGYSRAADALAAFAQEPQRFDLVLTDFTMPGMSGLEFAREVLAILPGASVAIVTGHVEPKIAQAAQQLGVLAMVAKPGTIEEMGRTMNELFAMKAER